MKEIITLHCRCKEEGDYDKVSYGKIIEMCEKHKKIKKDEENIKAWTINIILIILSLIVVFGLIKWQIEENKGFCLKIQSGYFKSSNTKDADKDLEECQKYLKFYNK